jgi:Ca-activated chloride channel family protein
MLTFAWPLALLGLLAVPLLLAVTVWLRRRPARYAVAFTNVELLRELATPATSWRRHLSRGLFLAALAALVVGLARPQAAVSVPTEHATIVLAMDVSGSMVASDVAPTRLDAAVQAAQTFVKGLPSTFEVGLVPFASQAEVAVTPTRDRQAVLSALGELSARDGTAIGEALSDSLGVLGAGGPTGAGGAAAPAEKGGRVILLLSDGTNTAGVQPLGVAERARAEGVPVYTIAFGTAVGTVEDPQSGRQIPVPPDPESLRAVAEASGGAFFDAPDADALERVYDDIGTQVGSKTERRDVSYAFAGAAAAFLVTALGLSTAWRGRLP